MVFSAQTPALKTTFVVPQKTIPFGNNYTGSKLDNSERAARSASSTWALSRRLVVRRRWLHQEPRRVDPKKTTFQVFKKDIP